VAPVSLTIAITAALAVADSRRCAVGAHELVEAGRQHVATGRVREAMACFKGAADDPERGAEALSLLAAAYLLPGSLAPELALANAHRAASHPAAGGEHLARCAAVALTAGDPSLAEELAGRAGRAGGGEALAIRATALLRLGDPARAQDLLSGLERASGPTVFWRRLVVEASAAGRLDIALAVRRAMRRGRLRAPALPDLLVRATAAPLFFACLAAATVLAVAVPQRAAMVVAAGLLAIGLGIAMRVRA
jgi:hypothetical protein